MKDPVYKVVLYMDFKEQLNRIITLVELRELELILEMLDFNHQMYYLITELGTQLTGEILIIYHMRDTEMKRKKRISMITKH